MIGAYVLNGVSDAERRAFEQHLTGCRACAQETAELRETAAWLGRAVPEVPAPDLWPRIFATIVRTRQHSP
jgi:anti-sigma factor RsiW